MKYQELASLISDGEQIRSPTDFYSEIDGICVTDNLIPLPLSAISSAYCADSSRKIYDFDISDESGNFLAILSLCRSYSSDCGEADVNSMTDAQYAAYIHEIDISAINMPFKFQRDYVVVDSSLYLDYKKCMSSAPIWGGFLHEDQAHPMPVSYKSTPANLVACSHIKLPTPFHSDSLIRSLAEPYAPERFLKLYHLIELLFDYDIVTNIQNLGADLHGIGQILSAYEKNEIDRLIDVIKNRCGDLSAICNYLDKVFLDPSYVAIAEDIFFKFGKTANPLNDFNTLMQIIAAGGFTHHNARTVKVKNLGPDPASWNTFVTKCASYFIYRIRCSVAHNKIGEYIMTSKDEPFVVNFAEPLIREVLRQAMV